MVAVGSVTGARTTLFGKNSDREYSEAQYLEHVSGATHEADKRLKLTYKVIDQVRKTHSVLLSKPHWIWGAEIGANEHDLVIGNEATFSRIEATLADGIIGMDYVRLALERAGDVDEAIHVIATLLREHGQSGNCGFRRELAYHNSYVLADRRGAKIMETVDREWVVSSVVGIYAVSNAMTIAANYEAASGTLLKRAEEAGLIGDGVTSSFSALFEDPARATSGHQRRLRATTMLGERTGRLQLTDFFCVLRDHEEGPPFDGHPGARICSHNRANPIGQTTASWVAELGRARSVHWVTGTAAPCTGLFKPVILGIRLPESGTTPGALPDSTSLWWSHEELRRRLDDAEWEVSDRYIDERNRLEQRFLVEMAKCPVATCDEAREEARQIVAGCWGAAAEFESRWLERLG